MKIFLVVFGMVAGALTTLIVIMVFHPDKYYILPETALEYREFKELLIAKLYTLESNDYVLMAAEWNRRKPSDRWNLIPYIVGLRDTLDKKFKINVNKKIVVNGGQ